MIVGGVFWSNALAYHDVWLAPRAQLRELELIGERFAGQGPALMTEYQPYGVRHFLRRLDAEGASELRVRLVPLTNGRGLGKAEFADLDRFATSGILVYRTLVLHSSPVESRPPAPYKLVWQGRYYEVWQRPDPSTPQVLEHLGLGDALHAAAVSACTDILRLGKVAAGAGGRLVAVPRTNGVLLPLARTEHPASWSSDSTGQTVVATSAGILTGSHLDVPASGRYTVWLGGSFARTVTISIDGHRVGSPGNMLNETASGRPSALSGSARQPHRDPALRRVGARARYRRRPVRARAAGAQPRRSPATSSASRRRTRARSAESLDWVEAVGP